MAIQRLRVELRPHLGPSKTELHVSVRTDGGDEYHFVEPMPDTDFFDGLFDVMMGVAGRRIKGLVREQERAGAAPGSRP